MTRRGVVWALALAASAAHPAEARAEAPAAGQPPEAEARPLAEAPAVHVDGEPPIALEALVAAVALRVDLTQLHGAVRVRSTPGEVTVAYAGRERAVPLPDPRAPAALRTVALLIADLVREEAALGALDPDAHAPSDPSGSSPAAPPSPSPPPRAPAPAASTRAPRALTTLDVALVAWVGLGSELDRPALGLSADASLALLPWLCGWASLGAAWWPPSSARRVTLSRVALPVRAGLAWSPDGGPLEVRAGALVLPMIVQADDPSGRAASRVDAAVALGGAVAYRVPALLDVTLLGGVDVALQPIEYRADGVRAFATDRVWLWLGAGVGWEVLP